MGLTNLRKQHAVGQGFFHSAELLEKGELRLRYVYDCGAMSKYAGPRSDRIKEYLHNAGARSKLDLLFISHVHADHLNGLPQLLHATTGLHVDTIVLPYFNLMERLIGYAREAIEDPAMARDEFYRDFVMNPIEALSGFRPRQILLVQSAGDTSPGAPSFDDGPEGPVPDIAGLPIDGKGVTWKPIGRGAFYNGEQGAVGTPASETVVVTVADSFGIAVPSSATGEGFWLLSPFIDPAVERHRGIFKAALLKALNHGQLRKDQIKKANFDAWLENSENLKDLVVNKVSDLVQAFSAVEKNLNISSMCLFSGPLPDGEARQRYHVGRFGKWGAKSESGIGWLATGDSDLKAKKRRVAFLRHYSKVLHDVATITLPHHGSDSNFDAELLTSVGPSFCVVAADTVGKWRHPGTEIVQAVASYGCFVSVVTSKEASEVEERGKNY
ncbi:hypothetical protein ACHMW7_03900 [Aminobacter sp. UC22_36]|uniref:hypothetical protein n=1 Tax=Aminobacter sp. UC22_36 TaxID=3374549 RepID=UPI00375660F3